MSVNISSFLTCKLNLYHISLGALASFVMVLGRYVVVSRLCFAMADSQSAAIELFRGEKNRSMLYFYRLFAIHLGGILPLDHVGCYHTGLIMLSVCLDRRALEW